METGRVGSLAGCTFRQHVQIEDLGGVNFQSRFKIKSSQKFV